MPSTASSPLFLGFDLSTQQLKALIVDDQLHVIHEEAIVFDGDDELRHYNTTKGVLTNPDENEVFAPVPMWIEALDLVLSRMSDKGVDLARVKGISGAGQQHGSVYWSDKAEKVLGSLDSRKTLVEQLKPEAFSHPWSPNWQDHSTQAQCESFEETVGGGEALARITGSRAHHRFTGPQILRFHQRFPEIYKQTAHISLVSSFLCSLFLGRIAPLDISDVCGMNLWDIHKDDWSEELLATAAEGEEGGVPELKKKLGAVERQHGKHLGNISKWFVDRYDFHPECRITPFTGDNPSTILALPLRPLDAVVSLGTSTTLLMATPTYYPSSSYHLFNHPTTPGLYMFMLCYCNGSLARERIRDEINKATAVAPEADSWDVFNKTALTSPIGGQKSANDASKIGIYFPLPENIPNVQAGTWRFKYKDGKVTETAEGWDVPGDDARAILESQALSMRMRASPLLLPDPKVNDNKQQPRRVYVVGGASSNQAIAETMGAVLGGHEGVYRLDIGGNACGLGAAYYAAWALEKKQGEKFEDFVSLRWNEEGRVSKIASGYEKGVFEKYGELMKGFEMAEKKIIETAHN